MVKRLFFVVIFLSLVCCHSHKRDLIPVKKLVPLLVEMHIADAVALDNQINIEFGPVDSATIYGAVLGKYGCTRQELEKTIKYYSNKPEKLNKIYDRVFSILSSRSEEYEKMYEENNPIHTLTIWNAPSRLRIIGDTVNYPGHYDIPIDSMGTYIITARIVLNRGDSSINPRLTAYFYNPDNPSKRKYFKTMILPKSPIQRDYTLVQKCDDPAFTKLRILIPEDDNQDQHFNKNMIINELQVRIRKKQSQKAEKKR